MILLSIVTINFNNAQGLQKTLASVISQTCQQFEHIIVDGGSTDGSNKLIEEYVANAEYLVKWVSEKDTGIYNGMNKGILMATGEYIQILNSGDCLADDAVVERMLAALKKNNFPDIMYGNMVKYGVNGNIIGKSGEEEYSLRQYYSATLNHDCAYIKRGLFDEYGLYDENLKVVSDWKWYLQAIGLGKVRPVYVDIDVTHFDAGGISETNLELRNKERRQVLEDLLPPAVLADYDKHSFDMQQMDNLRKHKWAYKCVWMLERVLNRIDNRNFRKPKNR